jgi:hypothetical protein
MTELLFIICTVVVWVLYHKIFNVVYFDFGRGCLTELMGCVCVGFLLTVFITQIF